MLVGMSTSKIWSHPHALHSPHLNVSIIPSTSSTWYDYMRPNFFNHGDHMCLHLKGLLKVYTIPQSSSKRKWLLHFWSNWEFDIFNKFWLRGYLIIPSFIYKLWEFKAYFSSFVIIKFNGNHFIKHVFKEYVKKNDYTIYYQPTFYKITIEPIWYTTVTMKTNFKGISHTKYESTNIKI